MSRPLRTRVAGAAVSAAVTLGIVSVAWAYFTTTGAGTASGSVTTLAASTISSATPGAGTVALSWTAVTPPGTGTVAYYVTRDGGAPAGNCPSSSSASSVTSCTDSGVSVGTHEYTVTAVWRSWNATSMTSTVQVSFGPATHLLLSAATTTPTAGAADNLTITAKDAYGNTVATYAGSHNLTFGGAATIGSFTPTVTSSSGTATNFGTATAITFTNGVATVAGANNGVMKLYKAETANITVSDGAINNGAGLSVTVGAGPAASLSLAAATTTPTAGAADNLTITALDAYGNTATTYTGSQNLTFGGAATIGSFNPTVTSSAGAATNFGTATAITFTNGVATVSGANNGVMTLYKAEDGDDHRHRRLRQQRRRPLNHRWRRPGREPVALGRNDDADSGRGRQPHDHREGHLRQHRYHLHRLAQPHLRRRRHDRLVYPDRDQQRGHGDQLRHGDGDRLHQRRRLGRRRQQRRDDPLQGEDRQNHRQRRGDQQRRRPLGDRQRRRRRRACRWPRRRRRPRQGPPTT